MRELCLDPTAFDTLEDGAEALLVAWSVRPGEHVEAGQELAVAELVKATLPVLAPTAGRVTEIRVPAGATFGRQAVLGTMQPD